MDHVRQVLNFVVPGNALRGHQDSGLIAGPPYNGIRFNIRSCEEEVPLPQHERALLRLANPLVVVSGWAIRPLALSTPGNDAAKKLSYP